MKIAFIIAFAFNVILALAALAVLPDQVAMNFGASGVPNSWVAKETYALIMLATSIPVFLLLFYCPRLMMKCPPSSMNIPNKDYWLSEENKPALKKKCENFMNQFGAAFFVFMFVVGLLVVHANISKPVRLNEGAFFTGLAAFLIYTVIWIVGIYRSFRIPE